jgi:hypothetical protein
LGKFLRRHKGPVLAASLVLLALLAGVMGTTFGLLRAQQRRQEAEQARTRAEVARDRTRQALDAMTSTVTGDSLCVQKAISEEQKKFLSEVLIYYQEFAGEKADDEASRARTAKAATRVGNIEYRLGRKTGLPRPLAPGLSQPRRADHALTVPRCPTEFRSHSGKLGGGGPLLLKDLPHPQNQDPPNPGDHLRVGRGTTDLPDLGSSSLAWVLARAVLHAILPGYWARSLGSQEQE